MKTIKIILAAFILLLYSCNKQPKHLFILSGQSNMVGLVPEESFIPYIQKELGSENVIFVKDAMNSQPIRRWYKKWKPIVGDKPKANPDLYKRLLNKTYQAIKNEKITSVTFVWMQGEQDAIEGFSNVYEESLKGLQKQLCEDLYKENINFIIGRLNDYDILNKKHPHWSMIRDIQVKVAESKTNFDWINTDDLNDGLDKNGTILKNDIHMSVEGYKIMGLRFAEKAIKLIKNQVQ